MKIQIKVLVTLVSVILITGAASIIVSETLSKNMVEKQIGSHLEITAQLRVNYLLILALFSAAGMLVSIIISRIVTQPLVKLHRGTEEIMKGNLDYKVFNKSEDEIGQLSMAFEKMTADLKKSRNEREEHSKRLERINEQLNLKITEQKRAEEERERLIKELEAKNAEMERFTYTVSHDLRSPLVTIHGFAGVLRKDIGQNNREKVEADLKFIEDATTKMDRLLSDTLQLSRIGRVVNPPEDVPFGELVQVALEQTAEDIKSSGVEVSVAEDFPTVQVDRIRIVEVLVNLIENCIKYMGEESHPRIDIGYREGGEENVFFVKDNGIGIDKSQHEKVFGLFYKMDKNSKGTGAGLAIVKRIIEVHDGRVWIESEEGKGCTVCFTLSVTRMKEEE